MPVSMRIHEPLELLAISGVAEIFHEFREFALGGNKLLAFFFQASSVVRHSSKARFPVEPMPKLEAANFLPKAPAVGAVRPVRPFFTREGNNVAGVTGFLLPEFPAQDREPPGFPLASTALHASIRTRVTCHSVVSSTIDRTLSLIRLLLSPLHVDR
jgi:hypothetical protein